MPKLRIEQHYDLRSLINEAVANVLKSDSAYESCLVCEKFDEKNELCKLANQHPPARIIAYGCPSFTDKEQPPF
jgi:hypothetical protein